MAYDGTIGADCKLYYDSAGSYATPTWVEVAKAIDLTMTRSINEVAMATRESKFQLSGDGLMIVSVDFTYLNEIGVGDTVYQALNDAFWARTITQFAVLDGASGTSGSKGIRMWGKVFQMDRAEDLEGAVSYSVSLKPSRYDDSGTLRVPEDYEIP